MSSMSSFCTAGLPPNRAANSALSFLASGWARRSSYRGTQGTQLHSRLRRREALQGCCKGPTWQRCCGVRFGRNCGEFGQRHLQRCSSISRAGGAFQAGMKLYTFTGSV